MDKKLPNSTLDDDSMVSFKPITEGLGFHPFSDGLPYAPMSKNPKSMSKVGAGAVAAGPPRMVTKSEVKPSVDSTIVNSNITGFFPPRVPRVSVPLTKKDIAAPDVQNVRGVAYIATRFLAYLFDVSLNSLVLGGILIALVWRGDLQLELLFSLGVPVGILLFFLVSSWGLIALEEALFRSSLGKSLFNLKLDGSRLGIVSRALLFPLSTGVFGLGIFWGLFHARRSCWHDILTGIQPTE